MAIITSIERRSVGIVVKMVLLEDMMDVHRKVKVYTYLLIKRTIIITITTIETNHHHQQMPPNKENQKLGPSLMALWRSIVLIVKNHNGELGRKLTLLLSIETPKEIMEISKLKVLTC